MPLAIDGPLLLYTTRSRSRSSHLYSSQSSSPALSRRGLFGPSISIVSTLSSRYSTHHRSTLRYHQPHRLFFALRTRYFQECRVPATLDQEIQGLLSHGTVAKRGSLLTLLRHPIPETPPLQVDPDADSIALASKLIINPLHFPWARSSRRRVFDNPPGRLFLDHIAKSSHGRPETLAREAALVTAARRSE